MNDILISVIVPIYNGERFLHRAVDSVVCQMDGRIELILVNDGSSDNSGRICDEYAAKNPNIKVIHKENGGTSSAKNRGIDIAKGQYLCFMDCDDFVDSDTYAEIIPLLLKFQPDCLDFGSRYVVKPGVAHDGHHRLEKNTLFDKITIEKLILPPLLNLCKDDEHFIFDFAVNKVFKSSIINEYNVRFDEDKRTWEDRTFLLRHLKHCENFYSMDRCFYNYVYVPNSLSQRYSLDYFRIIIANFNHYRELFGDKYDFDTQYANDYWSRSIENMIYLSLEQTENREIIQQNILDTLQNEQVIHWFSKRKPKTKTERAAGEYIINGKTDNALELYKKELKAKKRKSTFSTIANKLKITIKRLRNYGK